MTLENLERLEERIIWDKLERAMSNSLKNPSGGIPVDEFRQFLNRNYPA